MSWIFIQPKWVGILDFETRLPSAVERAIARTQAGSRFAERLLTMVASCREQGRPLLAFLVAAREAAVRGSPPPSLLLAPQGD